MCRLAKIVAFLQLMLLMRSACRWAKEHQPLQIASAFLSALDAIARIDFPAVTKGDHD